MRQGVTLLGLGTAMFRHALEAADEIYGVFSRALPEGSLESMSIEDDALHASNRLLTPKRDACNMTSLAVPDGIDPHGILTEIIAEGEYVYCEENKVQYFQQRFDENGTKM